MNRREDSTRNLRPDELEAVYAISRAVVEIPNVDKALAEIVRLARPVFIFDNAVLYLANEENGSLEPAFARAIGRGRSSEADSAWGEAAANEAFLNSKNVLNQPGIDPKQDRLQQRFYLGLPLVVGSKRIGALVFIRFGGPTFTDEQIHLAEFIAAHVTQVLEHKRLMEQVGNLEAERRLARLQSDFIATVSHELKTPLALIRMYAETLSLQRLKDQNRQHEYHKVILREAERLSRMIENVLDFERLRSGVEVYHLTETDLAASVTDVLARYESQLEESGVRLDVKLEHPLPPVAHDREGLTEILLNLLDNAGKYAQSGGLVQVRLARNNDHVELKVSDFGPGIPPQDRARMLRAFERGVVPGAAGGSGLGLALVEQIAKSHHARFTLDEPEGHSGVKAVVSFPISQGNV